MCFWNMAKVRMCTADVETFWEVPTWKRFDVETFWDQKRFHVRVTGPHRTRKSHPHPSLPFKNQGLELHVEAFFNTSSKSTLKKYINLITKPLFLRGSGWGGVGALHKEPLITIHQDPKIVRRPPPHPHTLILRVCRWGGGRRTWRWVPIEVC